MHNKQPFVYVIICRETEWVLMCASSEIFKEEYEEFKTKMPEAVNWAELLAQFETTDMTEGAQELACVAGNCEI